MNMPALPLRIFKALVLFFLFTDLHSRTNFSEHDRHVRWCALIGDDSIHPVENPNYFRSWGVTPAFESMVPKAQNEGFIHYLGGGYKHSFDTISYSSETAITLLCVTYEFRYNLYHYIDKASISTSIPVALSANIFENSGRLFSFALPVFFDANYGMHSTYNNIDRYGGHAGIGYQVIFAGLFGGGGSVGKSDGVKVWTQPVIRAGGKFPVRKRNCFFDVYWGLGKKVNSFEGLDGNNQPLYNPVRSKFYYKVVFGWLIHYD